MNVLTITIISLVVFVVLISLVMRIVLKRPIKEIITDWLAQFF